MRRVDVGRAFFYRKFGGWCLLALTHCLSDMRPFSHTWDKGVRAAGNTLAFEAGTCGRRAVASHPPFSEGSGSCPRNPLTSQEVTLAADR